MKKILMPLLLIALVLVSCEEDNTALNVNDLPKITMSGTVKADMDGTLSGDESVPDGTKLLFTVKYGATDNQLVTATTQGGNYSVEIPVVPGKTTVDINGENFIAKYKVTNDTSIDKLYTITVQNNIGCDKENNLIKDVKFTGAAVDNKIAPTGTISYSGKITRNTDANPDSIVPAGTTFVVKITLVDQANTTPSYETIQTVTVGANGAYKISVPMIKNGKATIEADTQEQFWIDEIDATTNGMYRYTISFNDVVYNTDYTDKDYGYTKKTLQNEISVTPAP